MGRRTVGLGTAVVVAYGLLVTGCTGVGTDTSPVRGAAAPTRSASARGLSDDEQTRLGHAEELLVSRCMARKGFTYTVRPPSTGGENRSMGYVLDDPAWAGKFGYGSRIRQESERNRRSDPNLVYTRKLSGKSRAAYDKALSGGPGTPELTVALPGGGTAHNQVGGCRATAQEQLYGERATWFRTTRVVSNLTPLYLPKLARDKRFTTAQAEWSRCMNKAGHHYRSPVQAREDLPRLTEGLSPDGAFAVEVRLARAEAGCAKETGFGATGRALEQEYRARLPRTYGRELDAYDRIRRTALVRAEKITGQAG
ncbi:hypothetical protein ACFYW1_31290 [Streptomyces sp. NPDC002669]|uniref:hypothetical protein n=1 Tax=Streptomyces sp. NPDC002669 TaxID=3364658 RepID=UPI0036B5BACF